MLKGRMLEGKAGVPTLDRYEARYGIGREENTVGSENGGTKNSTISEMERRVRSK